MFVEGKEVFYVICLGLGGGGFFFYVVADINVRVYSWFVICEINGF